MASELVDGARDFGITAIIDAKTVIIAESFGRVSEDIYPNAQSNVRLIAAAPELLAAVKDLCRMMDEQILVRNTDHDASEDFFKNIMAFASRLKLACDAINKAEGRDSA